MWYILLKNDIQRVCVCEFCQDIGSREHVTELSPRWPVLGGLVSEWLTDLAQVRGMQRLFKSIEDRLFCCQVIFPIIENKIQASAPRELLTCHQSVTVGCACNFNEHRRLRLSVVTSCYVVDHKVATYSSLLKSYCGEDHKVPDLPLWAFSLFFTLFPVTPGDSCLGSLCSQLQRNTQYRSFLLCLMSPIILWHPPSTTGLTQAFPRSFL